MHRTNGDSYGVGTSSHSDPTIHIYRDESAGSYDATQLRHQEMNAIQEEICDVIEHESIVLNADTETPATMTQLRAALDARHIASRVGNDSGVSGSFVDDALDNLDELISNLGQWHIRGCSHVRHASLNERVLFNDGYAMDTTGAMLMRMPRYSGSTYAKVVTNGSGYVAGHGNTGIPDGVTVAANTKLAIFLLRLPSGDFDIGFDTDIDATNLLADTDCLATHYRRIGFCMAYSMSGSDGQLYYFRQHEDGFHEVLPDSTLGAYPYYTKTAGSSGTDYSADIYTPLNNMYCEIMYQVAQPSGAGGAATCYVCPSALAGYYNTLWTTWNLWHASSSVTAPYHTNFIQMRIENGTLHVVANPYTSIDINFNIFGWIDHFDKNFPGT